MTSHILYCMWLKTLVPFFLFFQCFALLAWPHFTFWPLKANSCRDRRAQLASMKSKEWVRIKSLSWYCSLKWTKMASASFDVTSVIGLFVHTRYTNIVHSSVSHACFTYYIHCLHISMYYIKHKIFGTVLQPRNSIKAILEEKHVYL